MNCGWSLGFQNELSVWVYLLFFQVPLVGKKKKGDYSFREMETSDIPRASVVDSTQVSE